PSPWVHVKPCPAERRFAFLLHPLDYTGAIDFDRSLAHLFSESLEDVVHNVTSAMEPFVMSHGRVVSKTGDTVYGEFITLPRTTQQLVDMPRREAIAYVRKAVHMARERGAQMVGLGAFTSVVTLGGRAVADE